MEASRGIRGPLLAAALAAASCGGGGTSTPAPRVPDQWTSTGRLLSPHLAGASANLLPDGRVVLIGGTGAAGAPTADTEIYDPEAGSWSLATPAPVPLLDHTATLLRSGELLVAGGLDPTAGSATAQAHLFLPNQTDPGSHRQGRWVPIASMIRARGAATATLLADGRVLVAGGCLTGCAGGHRPGDPSDAEIYDPSARSGSQPGGGWTLTGPMAVGRGVASAVRLEDGRVLVVGGQTVPGNPLPEEIFDPAGVDRATHRSGTWQAFSGDAATSIDLIDPTVTLLVGGDVLVTGGRSGDNGRGERVVRRFHAADGRWSLEHLMPRARYLHSAVRLASGDLLVVGGKQSSSSAPLSAVDLYDPATGLWTAVARTLSPHAQAVAVLLSRGRCGSNCGRVLIAGGVTCFSCPEHQVDGIEAELYTPR